MIPVARWIGMALSVGWGLYALGSLRALEFGQRPGLIGLQFGVLAMWVFPLLVLVQLGRDWTRALRLALVVALGIWGATEAWCRAQEATLVSAGTPLRDPTYVQRWWPFSKIQLVYTERAGWSGRG
jgi:hypothetical protein